MTSTERQQLFNTWLHQYKGLVVKIVRAYAIGPMDQDDLFQEIMLQVYRSIPGFRNESAASTWIYRIALNTAMRWLSREKKFRQTNHAVHNLPEVLLPVPADEHLNWLYATIHQLNEIDRSVMLLLLDGCSYKEMSTILGISESHVGVKINRIKKQLSNLSKKYRYGI